MRSTWRLALGVVLAVALVLLGAGQPTAVADQSGARLFLPLGLKGDGLPAGTPLPTRSALPSPTPPPGASATATAVPPSPTATAAPLSTRVPAGAETVLQN